MKKVYDEEVANNMRDNDLDCLLFFKKLHLVLDLDHTLIHSIKPSLLALHSKQYPNSNPILHRLLHGNVHVKFRPGVVAFLNELRGMYNLSIFTMGSKAYGKAMAKLLEDCGDGFHFREVLGREDCVVRGRKTLEKVLSHERVILIVDDTEEVWRPSYCETNLIKIEPYRFFSSEGGGVEKEEEEEGVMDGELARVLRTLKSVHGAFYKGGEGDVMGGEDCVEVDCSDRDVREVLKLVREEEMKSGDGGGGCLGMAMNGKRSYGDYSFDQPAVKKYKTGHLVDLPACVAC
ncbi:hypothetical protein vseg_017012 [Gypsophila vaccaria]